jgi:calcineurin-like phosphoesterase family protein
MSNTPEHTLYHLGDVVVGDSPSSIRFLRLIRNKYSKTKWVLVKGNYDDDRTDIHQYFDEIYESDTYTDVGGYNVYLNHYPTKVVDAFNHSLNPYDFGLTGHIHGLWKVQKNMINVGVDAWHFRPVSEDEILFCWNAMQNHYDMNVFPY